VVSWVSKVVVGHLQATTEQAVVQQVGLIVEVCSAALQVLVEMVQVELAKQVRVLLGAGASVVSAGASPPLMPRLIRVRLSSPNRSANIFAATHGFAGTSSRCAFEQQE
jgi:hypothetical protein